MDDFDRIWTELVGRLTGPLTFRVILQPAMAVWLATRDGMMDARTGRPPYFWSIFHDAAERRHLLTEGWKHIRRVAVLGTVMDLIYQMLVFKGFRPLELVIVVCVLAILPYLLLRGPINRVVARWRHGRTVAHRN